MRTYFFFNDTATTEIYTLSLHDALPICGPERYVLQPMETPHKYAALLRIVDRKSTRLNSSHSQISYAVFCLKKKTIDLSYEENVDDALRLYRMLQTIDACPSPVVGRVQG